VLVTFRPHAGPEKEAARSGEVTAGFRIGDLVFAQGGPFDVPGDVAAILVASWPKNFSEERGVPEPEKNRARPAPERNR